ncbi:acyl-CoA dehydrogenase family protein [Bradyrhizobium sp. STM 3562]|uniref:acyl-CoA dehydrogenase family protein n=1 Tax=Bradyrhizobium sp. STM 3562 TaxID=578924 RepID=UPI00388CFBAE
MIDAILPADLGRWLDGNALELDVKSEGASSLLPKLGGAGLFKIGVPTQFGGSGADVAAAIGAIAAVSARSLAAGFVFWGHRTFIEYLLQSPNGALRERLLPDLLAGHRAGATGLSNAMKFLNGLEELQLRAAQHGQSIQIEGKLPWVTNLRKEGFDVAAAVRGGDRRPAFVISLSSDDDGVERSGDLDLMAMRATNTAAIKIGRAVIGEDRIIHANASEWLLQVRPAFLGLQCGMSIGLARRSLSEAQRQIGSGRGVLMAPIERLAAELHDLEARLLSQVNGPLFVDQPILLFRLRIRLAKIVSEALELELGATGGKAYLSSPGEGYQRRLRESAFIPVVTPSLVQLKAAIEAQEQPTRAREIA